MIFWTTKKHLGTVLLIYKWITCKTGNVRNNEMADLNSMTHGNVLIPSLATKKGAFCQKKEQQNSASSICNYRCSSYLCRILLYTDLSIQFDEFGSKMSWSQGFQMLVHNPRNTQYKNMEKQC